VGDRLLPTCSQYHKSIRIFSRIFTSANAFQVTYRDTSSESHVRVERIDFEPGDNIYKQIMKAMAGSSGHPDAGVRQSQQHSAVDVRANNEKAFLDAIAKVNKMNEQVHYDFNENDDAEDTEFVVQPEENIDEWIRTLKEGKVEVKQSYGRQKDPYRALVDDAVSSNMSALEADAGLTKGSSFTSSANKKTVERKSREFRVSFYEPPLGLTLSKGYNGRAEVTRVTEPDGMAYKQGVRVGDVVVGYNGHWMQGYDELMAEMATKGYPMTLVVRRGLFQQLSKRGVGVIKGSKVRQLPLIAL